MSTNVIQPHTSSSWKQEVSLRLALHQSRRGWRVAAPSLPAQSRAAAGSRARLAAARVAARYAQAPSFSQLQAVNPRAISMELGEESLSRAEAQDDTAAKLRVMPAPPLFEMHDSAVIEDVVRTLQIVYDNPSAIESEAAPVSQAPPESLEAWERDFSPDWRIPDAVLRPIELVQPKKPEARSAVNLIPFPREVVAPRKTRTQRAERAIATEGMERQLSIFEVDPGPQRGATGWMEAQPAEEAEYEQELAQPQLHLAPLGRRLTAFLADGALVTVASLAFALVAADNIGPMPSAKVVGIGATAVLLLTGLLYQTIFLALDEATPGMRITGLSLCTFDGRIPTPAELRGRLGALLLSVIPLGLGLAWALIDDDRLCWHDRISRTYLRKE